MRSKFDSNEVLSIGAGHFGALTQTHFFNALDETVNRVENRVAASRLTELSCVACGPFYHEVKEELFEPNLVLISQSSELTPYELVHEASQKDKDAGSIHPPTHIKPHPYQVWADTPLCDRPPRPDFRFDTTVKSFQDIADFSVPLGQIARVRPQRPSTENNEAAEDTIRRQIEKCDRIELVSLAHELTSDDPDWDVPEVHNYVLEELGKAALLQVVGASPVYSRIVPPPEAGSDSTKKNSADGGSLGSFNTTCISRSLLSSIRSFFSIYDALRNRTAKCILPVYMNMRSWHPALQETVSFSPASPWDVPGVGSFDKMSAYQKSGLGALILDGVTIPFRQVVKGVSAYTSIAQLVPTYCPVLTVATSVVRAGDRGPITQAAAPDLHDLSSFCPTSDPQFLSYPGHNYYAYYKHGDGDLRLKRDWSNAQGREFELREPFVASESSIWASPAPSAKDLLLDVQSVVRSPINSRVRLPRSGSDDSSSSPFLTGSLAFLKRSMHNTTLIDRGTREEWDEVSNSIQDILEELNLFESEEPDTDD